MKQWWHYLIIAIIAMLILYFVPVVVIATYNLVKLVIFGDMPYSEFQSNLYHYSHEPIKVFYDNLYGWFKNLEYRMKN